MANSTNILNPKNKEIKQIASRSCPINVTTNISEISSGSTSSLEISTSEYKYD
ncbi:hypothetical protein A3Q56_08419 [Intoshia linei]|uniref:Uncharacterized protein n=1 Tax=Intoshia linei TaxID=1819745 RepID=A0A177AR59_9BILA|nr:hypothetical protein A3Q56_08419 [Intoshia linei]